MTVYADILLLVNFSMDFLTLALTGRLLHKPMRRNRLIIAALLGSFCGTLWSVLYTGDSAFLSVGVGLLFASLMAHILFEKNSAVENIRNSLSVWGAGIVLGGVMTCVLSLGEPIYLAESQHAKAFLPTFAVCFVLTSALMRFYDSAKSKKSAQVTVESAGVSYSFRALCDSGSFVTDPISGKPVILVRCGVLIEFEKMLEWDVCTLRLRMIPVEGVGGSCVLKGFVPDRVTVNDVMRDAVIAIHRERETFSGYDGILPAALCG